MSSSTDGQEVEVDKLFRRYAESSLSTSPFDARQMHGKHTDGKCTQAIGREFGREFGRESVCISFAQDLDEKPDEKLFTRFLTMCSGRDCPVDYHEGGWHVIYRTPQGLPVHVREQQRGTV